MNVQKPISEAEALCMLAECFDAAAASLGPETTRESIAGWDSMGALMLMAELDERFGLELTADTSRAMNSIGDALSFMREHGVLCDRA
jgi:acyl carrier protein